MTTRKYLYLLLLCFILLITTANKSDWGFYGHRKINRLAIFTLPEEILVFYKNNIEWITEHSVDPDKRRYAAKQEAVRHYIDIDHWGPDAINIIPKDLPSAIVRYMNISILNSNGDTTLLYEGANATVNEHLLIGSGVTINTEEFTPWLRDIIMPAYYDGAWVLSPKNIIGISPSTPIAANEKLLIEDKFSEYGICPYYLLTMYNRLIYAFETHDKKSLLRLSAEMGHYIGDGHVPLHTTENYNGQLSNQDGIHAFWESRIPELFDNDYDFFVGKAEYIEYPSVYFWDIIKESHSLLDSVLAIEKRLSISFPSDNQYCYEERLGRTKRMECEDYAAAYQDEMQGMVEKRMRDAVLSIGSVWYSAWVDAGQPDLRKMDEKYIMTEEEKQAQETLDKNYREGNIYGRQHGN